MLSKRGKDKDKSQNQAEEMQKMRRQWAFICICLSHTAPKVLDWKLILKEEILPGLSRR